MSGTSESVLTELIPLAVVIAASPLSIIPAILVLHTPRPREAGLAFLAGWLVGLTALTAIFLGVSSLLGGLGGQPPSWASWLRVVIGSALIVFGVFRWVTRHKNPHVPKWMSTITESHPARAGITGLALTVVNPKVLFICAAAGLSIGTAGLAMSSTWLAAAIFVAVAASTVFIPIVAYAVSGRKLDPMLNRLKTWMEKHNASLVAIILVVIGIMVLYKGIHGL
ncbi:MAG: GAP family protein [Mycobacterium sp.]